MKKVYTFLSMAMLAVCVMCAPAMAEMPADSMTEIQLNKDLSAVNLGHHTGECHSIECLDPGDGGEAAKVPHLNQFDLVMAGALFSMPVDAFHISPLLMYRDHIQAPPSPVDRA